MSPDPGEPPGHLAVPDLGTPPGDDLVPAGADLDAEAGRGRYCLTAAAVHQPQAQVMLASDWSM